MDNSRNTNLKYFKYPPKQALTVNNFIHALMRCSEDATSLNLVIDEIDPDEESEIVILRELEGHRVPSRYLGKKISQMLRIHQTDNFSMFQDLEGDMWRIINVLDDGRFEMIPVIDPRISL